MPPERTPRNGREERAPRGDRNEGRRDRRSEGAPRPDEATPADQATETTASGEGMEEVAPRREGEERRGRSRDRYGRDRRERSPREEGDAGQAAPAVVSEFVQVEVPAAPIRTERAAAPLAPPIVVEAKAPSSRALPKVQPFELPLHELAQVAEGSGLHWVNSDADRVAEVRAAIAAEPKAVHVPRERPPAIVIDEGPLVLVETRRELNAMVLPFEQQHGQDASVRP